MEDYQQEIIIPNEEEEESYQNVPKSNYSENSYRDFNKIVKAYYKELKNFLVNRKEFHINKDDAIVISDLVNEINEYTTQIIKGRYFIEAKNLLVMGIKLTDVLFKLVCNSQDKNGSVNQAQLLALSLKLSLLETLFKILFKHENNYTEAGKALEDIMKLQKLQQLPLFYLGCSLFYKAIINFYSNDVKGSELMAIEALNHFEESSKKGESSGEGENYIESKLTRKMSNVLEFLAELYYINLDYKNVLVCYEKAYYLNLGRYGAKNVNTEYFKLKIEIVTEQTKSNSVSSHIKNFLTTPSVSMFTPEKIHHLPQLNNTNTNTNTNLNLNNISYNTNTNFKLLDMSVDNHYMKYSGVTDTFKFVIPQSNVYEPYMISFYDNSLKENIFVANLFFDKLGIFKFLKVAHNPTILYSQENISRIISCITLIDGNVMIIDPSLQRALINKNKIQQLFRPKSTSMLRK